MKLYLKEKTHTHKYRVIHLKTNKHIYLLHSRNKRTKMAIQTICAFIFLHLNYYKYHLFSIIMNTFTIQTSPENMAILSTPGSLRQN